MAAFRDVDIDWGGKTWRVTPSNRLLRRIEAEDVSLQFMLAELQRGRVKLSHLAFVMAMVLRDAGATVTEDQMLTEMVSGDQTAVFRLAENVLAAIFPVEDAGGKPEPRAGGRPAKVRGRDKS